MSAAKKDLPPVVVSVDPNKRWLTTAEAAEYLSVSVQSIRGFLHRGEIPAVRLGPSLGGYHIDREDLDKWLERRKRIVKPYRRGSRPYVAERWARQRDDDQRKAR